MVSHSFRKKHAHLNNIYIGLIVFPHIFTYKILNTLKTPQKLQYVTLGFFKFMTNHSLDLFACKKLKLLYL